MRFKAFLLPTALALALSGAPGAFAAPADTTGATPTDAVDLDVLFVSAHPDDEASSLATLGQWKEKHGVRSGVVTITRGEGGGNAVGLEEGPPLGIIREREERTAIGRAGVENLYNLDRVDFWYTASAPLSEQIWGHDDTLAQIVRVIRTTRPEIVMTMNPSPTPGNHGNHQQAARFAAEAFHAAADPKAFPEQITKEGLTPFRAAKFLRTGGTGTSSAGPACATSFTPTVPTDQVFGVWEGTPSKTGKTWGEIEVDARRDYVTQGWANTAAAPTTPAQIRCDFYTLVDSRVPYDPADTSPEAILRGSVLPPAAGQLPEDTEFHLTADRFDLTPGQTVEVTAHVRAAKRALTTPTVSLRLPEGWTAEGSGTLRGAVAPGKERTVTFTVTVPADADTNQQSLLGATLTTGQGTGRTDRAVRVVADVRGTLEPLPEVGIFRDWAGAEGYPQLDTLIKPVLTLGSGKSREVRVDLRNHGTTAQSGTVALGLPAGFTADAATKSYTNLAAGATGSVTFTVTNSDPSLPTANEGGVNGDYGITITTTSQSGTNVEAGALEIVPTSEVPHAGHDHEVDGAATPGEYPGEELDFSRIWEGQSTTPQDASAVGRIAYTEDALKVIVQVTDDVLGKKVVPQDCKRQRRTDSVEIIVDPKGNSSDTSTVFKAGIFPITDDPANGNPPCWQRDADNRQGPGAQTAPGMTVVSKVNEPYTGYTIEASIPFSVLPDAVDPARMGFNVLVYDSDTQDLSSQSRLGWSTFTGVRADPYRYGLVTLPGYTPADREPSKPIFPATAARSVHSPQTIAQSAMDGVAPAAVAKLPEKALRVTDQQVTADGVRVTLRADRAGTAYLYTWDGERALGTRTVELTAGGQVTVVVPVTGGTASSLLAAIESGDAARAYQVPLG
ncbi:sugar-binding protein [Micromonospora sagamiensis]|uniref:Alpha-galactosidase-like protein n=1 Tax=Micromonospora sagamiensis TaxID=47875 RepID=A0A562WCA9_9ACTN|nr:PIG-L family deacetylase [Micromonospora sagamiensis]TWJ27903.1 alpha-galactosidase-like protein [Micromonospora sagamiensis]BCL13207.1 LmbE-like protein [Micromonospora sagamiensis]